MFSMFGFERCMSALWICSCYSVFAISVFLAKQIADPVLPAPVPYFPELSVQAMAELNNEPIPSCEIVSVPVALDARATEPTAIELLIESDLPRGVSLLNPATPILFATGSARSAIRLMVNWRVVRQLATIPLKLSTGPSEIQSDKNLCNLHLYPLPTVTGSIDKPVFDEGIDDKISINYQMAAGFPKPITLTVKLLCDDEIARCIPIIEKVVEFAPLQTQSYAVFEVPDNVIATSDREINVSTISPYTRINVAGRRPKLSYNDDEQVYNVELITTGLSVLDEEALDAIPVLLKAKLTEPCGAKGLEIPLLIQGIAQQNLDYKLSDKAFKFLPGQSESVIELDVINDNRREGTESFSISMKPDNFLRFIGASTAKFTIQDKDPLFVYAKLSPVPGQLIEGDSLSECSVDFVVAPGQLSIKSWTLAQRSFRIMFKNSREDLESLNTLELIGGDGKVVLNSIISLNADGKATARLRAKDDSVPNGLQIGTIQFVTPSFINVQSEEMVVVIEDNDPLDATLTIEGESRSINGGEPEWVLDENDTQRGLFLRLSLAEPAERDFDVALRVFGKADAQDYTLGPSPYLQNDVVGKSTDKKLIIPKGTKTFSIPIFSKDDDAFEGSEDLSFDLVPSLRNNRAKLTILDNDSVIVGFDRSPLIIKEGELSSIRVSLKNAPDGITRPMPFSLSLEGGDASAKQLTLKMTEGEIPAKKTFVDLPLQAKADNLPEGRQAFKVKLEIPSRSSANSKAGPPLDVWVDDIGFEAKHAVVLVVTPNFKKEWGNIREGLAKIISSEGPRLAGGGIVMVGADSEPALWKVTSTQLPLQPVIDETGDVIFNKVIRAINSQMSKEFASAEATIFWDVTDTSGILPYEKISFPDSERLTIRLMLYGADASSPEVSALKSIASQHSKSTRQHRIGLKNDISKMPGLLETILQGSLKQ